MSLRIKELKYLSSVSYWKAERANSSRRDMVPTDVYICRHEGH